MSASNPEVVADHVSDLSSAKEPIFFLSFLFLQTDLFSWSRNSEWSYSKQKQFSSPAFQNSENPYPQLIARIIIHPLKRPSPLLWSITWLQGKSEPGFRILSSNMKTLNVWWISRTEAPIFAVFAVQPQNSVEFSRDRLPCTYLHWIRTCGTGIRRVKNSLIRCL